MSKVKKNFHANFMFRDNTGQLETKHMNISARCKSAAVKVAKEIATRNHWRLRGTYEGAYPDGSK